MANSRCVLCGLEVNWLNSLSIDLCDTKQKLCADCHRKYYNASQEQKDRLEQEMLSSPHLVNRDIIQHYQQGVLGKTCPNCGGAMERKLKNFSIGADGRGYLTDLLLSQYAVDLFACASCGKVELYTAQTQQAQEEPEPSVTCPVCGFDHHPVVGCPRCAMNVASGGVKKADWEYAKKNGSPDQGKRSPFRGKKPPWEK